MTPRSATPPPRTSALKRFGPLSVVLSAIVVAGVLASTGRGDEREARVQSEAGSAADRIPISYQEAEEKGTVDDYDWGDGCDTDRGRVKLPSVYAPPCLVSRPGIKANTRLGVTKDTIKIVIYQAADDDLSASLTSTMDPESDREQTQRDLIEMFSRTLETWGRKVEVVMLKGSGSSQTAARADAIKVATEFKAFASIGGPQQETAYAEELANRGVLCISCSLSAPNSFYQEHAPYMWGNLQTPEQYLPTVGEVNVGMLNKHNAIYAGDPKLHDKTRVFGSVNFEQDPPIFGPVGEEVDRRSAAMGFERKVKLTYQLVVAELGEKARGIITQLKKAGVTTVIFLGDPIMPIYLTKEATNQNYFPEWMITGTVFTDTSTFGRMYDQRQWAHAFGISSLPTPTTVEQGEGYRLNEWFYGKKPAAPKSISVLYDPLRMFMFGVHMAGPELTPETFRDGLFAYPPSGGSPTQPQISWGNHGVFDEPDYLAVDDMSLIWYDPDAVGPDEQGKDEDGTGRIRHVDGGKRFLPGTMPKSEDWIHDPEGTVFDYADGYPGDKTPSYPRPS